MGQDHDQTGFALGNARESSVLSTSDPEHTSWYLPKYCGLSVRCPSQALNTWFLEGSTVLEGSGTCKRWSLAEGNGSLRIGC